MGNYKKINQKGLAFHVEAKQKNYKKENKLRKPYEALILMLVSFYRLFCSKDLGNILQFIFFVNSFQISIFPEFLYFAEDLLPILFLRYCRFYFLFLLLRICFMCWFKKQLGLLHIWPIHKGRCFLRIIYSKNTKLTIIIIVKAQINPITRILIKTMNLFIIIVQ